MPRDLRQLTSALIIANPRAGTTSPALVEEVAARCSRLLPSVQVHRTTGRGDATTVAAAADDPTALVIAVGGDGTVREVVQGLPPGGATLFVVPAGTGNSGYLAQWGDLPWRYALTAALGGPAGRTRAVIRELDLCRLAETGQLVVLGACSGLIAEALLIAPQITASGRARYVEALARAADIHRPYAGRVEVDGTVVHEGPTVLANVGGGRHRGGTYAVLPRSVLDDGLLDVCVIGGGIPASDVPGLTERAAHDGLPDVVHARGRRITVASTGGEPFRFEHDGELVAGDRTSYTLDVVPAALRVVCRADRPHG
jgi:diacylglycerol kinase (ATP)